MPNLSSLPNVFQTEAEREWFAQRIESGQDPVVKSRQIEIAKELLHSQAWDKFLSVKYPTVKRYCGEGAESLLTFLSTLFRLTTSGKMVLFLQVEFRNQFIKNPCMHTT